MEDKEQEHKYQVEIKKLERKHQNDKHLYSSSNIKHMSHNLRRRIKRIELSNLSVNVQSHSVNYTLYTLKKWCIRFPEEKKYYNKGIKKNQIYSIGQLEKHYLNRIQEYNSNPQLIKEYMNAIKKLYQQSKFGIKFYFQYQGVFKPLSKAQLLLFILSSFN